ncbi:MULTISPECIES: hypothetical protein [Providencia]|uniref:hypothetical protein n=1 Tax=Providencia TaxID=586 RepID=UPI0015EB6BEE|nr:MULTISPECIES: hypothetical protein [unclassified Providencia]ELR5139226.1 hypothetical protein [Providencia rettgeri]QLQ93651.1 hypothetical protein H0907_20810 [Providencia rettgeri]WEB84269.1 hypothetical protein LVJ10_20830 [Providencia rettgeri]HCH7934595.1 hypothetical protein [Providencia rettgeri]HEM6858751.1 hypothetical protein [Providencia rettgeri]
MYYIDSNDVSISNSQAEQLDFYGRLANKINNGAGLAKNNENRLIRAFNGKSSHCTLLKEDNAYVLVTQSPETNTVTTSDIKAEQQVISINDAVSTLKSKLGLPTLVIAEMAGVSRATLYNHMSLSNDVTSFESQYQRIFDIAIYLEKNNLTIKNGLKSVLVDGKTLLSHLKNKNLETDILISYIDQVAEKLTKVKLAKQLSIEEERYLLSNTSYS